jgi:LEA14-like dessication related protein
MKTLFWLYRFCLLWLFAGGAVSCAVIQQVVEKPTVEVEAVTFHALSLSEGRLDSRLQIHNPNGFALPVRALSYRLKINGHQLLDSELAFDKQIPARGSLSLQLPMRFHYREALDGIGSVLQQHRIRFQLLGELDLQLVRIPFSKSGELTLRP